MLFLFITACNSVEPEDEIYVAVTDENGVGQAAGNREDAGVFSATEQADLSQDDYYEEYTEIILPSEGTSNNLSLTETPPGIYILPVPQTDGTISVEEALYNRRSRRHFQDRALTTEQVSQILWAAYGITSDRGFRTAPSAGALYPLEIYIVIGNVEGIAPGVYLYIAEEHKIIRVIYGDIREELAQAALGQRSVSDAPAILAYSAVFERMIPRYGERGIMYTHIEVGHSGQNVYLQAEALGLGTVAVGAFIDYLVGELLNLSEYETPLYLMPFGYFY